MIRAVPFACALAVLVFGTGRALGALVVRASLERPLAEWILPLAGLAAAAAAVAALRFAAVRTGLDRRGALAASGLALLLLAAAWTAWVAAAPPSGAPTDLAKLTPMPPSREIPEVDTRRPAVTYRTNSIGYRDVDWPKRAEGEQRVLVVGDSFVFGMGVEVGDTLPAQLARAWRGGGDVLFLNLGVPGANLRTHVDVLEAALALGADPDAVLVAVTSNDFEGWNPGEAREARRTLGGYSLAQFLLGERAGPWLRAALFGLSTGASAQERMRVDELHRLDALAARAGFPLLVFAYTPGDVAKLADVLGTDRVTSMPALEPAWFIPGDGHPTGAGNAAFAKHLAPRLAALLP